MRHPLERLVEAMRRPGAVLVVWAVLLALIAIVEWAVFLYLGLPDKYLFYVLPAFAIGATLVLAVIALAGRDPAVAPAGRPLLRPDLSVSTALVGFALGALDLGVQVGAWLLYIGLGMLVLGLGGVARERRAQRRTRR